MSAKTHEVWALIPFEQTNLLGRIKGAESAKEILAIEDGWIQVEMACSYNTQVAHLQNGQQAVIAVCLPFGASPDPDVTIWVRIDNVRAIQFFDDMTPRTRSHFESKIREAHAMCSRLAAASAGLVTR